MGIFLILDNYDKFIAPDKMLFSTKNFDIFLFSQQKTCRGYSLEVPNRGSYNDYPQLVFMEK